MFHHFFPTEGVSIAQFQTGPDIFMLKTACFRGGGEEGININNPQASDMCCRVVWHHTVPLFAGRKFQEDLGNNPLLTGLFRERIN